MTKEFALNHYSEECEKSEQLMDIRNMESMLEEIKNDDYVNSYKWEKIQKSYEEYQRYRKESRHNIEIYNIVKTLED